MINETILAAAQYMDKHGKARGMYENDEGGVCIMGALRVVIYGKAYLRNGESANRTQNQELGACRCRLERYGTSMGLGNEPGIWRTVTGLNDHHLKTKEETVKFMMEAAEWEPPTE